MTSFFPDPRRIVTGHNSEGRAVVVADSPIPCVPTPTGANFAVLYETNRFPASNDEWIDPTKTRTTDLSNQKGIILRVMFHRTESLDFGILLNGEVSCHLDDGVRIDMKPGDVCVQRGTIHGWTNYSDEPARLYFVLSGKKAAIMLVVNEEDNLTSRIAATPVKIDGKLLTAYGYNKEEVESGGASHH
ncbi:hypothetical protein GGI43DRAFT_421637 [Trichoderma evansii]